MNGETTHHGECAGMTVSAVPASASPDAELAYLFSEWRRLDEEKLDAEDNDQRQEAGKLRQAEERTFERLIATPANTIEGIRLKLEAGARWQGLREDAAEGDWSARAIISALDDAGRLAEVTDMPDPVVDLIARYHEAVATINAFEVKDGVDGDAELNKYCNEVFDPVRDNLMTTRPTSRAGLVLLLDLAVNDPDMDYNESWMMPGLIENARDAVKGAALGAMVPIEGPGEDPIFGLISACRRADAELRAKSEHIKGLQAKIPFEVRHWPGILFGTRFLHGERQINQHFAEARGVVEANVKAIAIAGGDAAHFHEDLSAVDNARQQALDALSEHMREKAECYETAGMPFGPEGEDEDEFFSPFIDALNAAETAVIEGPPTTPAGFAVKVAFVAGLEVDCEPTLAAFGRDAAALIKEPVNDISELGAVSYAPVGLDEDAVLKRWDDWQANRGKERATLQIILPLLNVDDSEVERLVREGGPEEWSEMMEACQQYDQMHDCIRDIMEAATVRLATALACVVTDEQAAASPPGGTA